MYCDEKPALCKEEWPLVAATRESLCATTKTQHSHKERKKGRKARRKERKKERKRKKRGNLKGGEHFEDYEYRPKEWMRGEKLC